MIGFRDQRDTQRVMEVVPKRFGKYGLTVHPTMTKLSARATRSYWLRTVSPERATTFEYLPPGRVAVGRYRPTAPTDPYVPTLEHTVPQVMVSLRARKLNVKCERAPAGIAGADDETSAKSSFAHGCGE